METGLVISMVLLWVVVLLNLLLTLALIRRLNRTSTSPHAQAIPKVGPEVGQRAPDFTAQTLDGATVTRESYTGKKVALVFISTHCGPCREALPRLEQLGPKAARGGIELLLVSSNEAGETRILVESLTLHLPVLVAPSPTNPLTAAYQATATPSYCFIDEQGIVQSAGLLILEGGQWETLVDSWAKQGVPVA